MPLTDLVVLTLLPLATATSAVLLWRRGIRGGRLFAATWLAFYGFVLVFMMAAHSIDIAYNTLRGGMAFDGSPWMYNFRVYALHLLGAVLIWQGVRCLLAVPGTGRGDAAARTAALRATLVVLAVVAPLIPIHAFFGILLTVISAISLLVMVLARRGALQPPGVPDVIPG